MKFGLIGHPINHSQSPALFAAAYPGGEHSYELIEEPDFDKAYSRFVDGYDAVNVTTPFKELAAARADVVNDVVKACGASNLLKKEGGKVYAYNTDYLGVRRVIEERDFKGDVLVVGCGGAAKAAALAAADAGHNVFVANRDEQRAVSFVAANIGRSGSALLLAAGLAMIPAVLPSVSFIIYCIPVTLPQLNDASLAGKTLFEANYRSPQYSAGHGYEYIPGEVWLAAQGDESFRLMLR
jgi:shikimate 5-dehydrogenase